MEDQLKIKNSVGLIGKYYTKNYYSFFIGYFLEAKHYDDYYMYDYELGINGPAFKIPEMDRYFMVLNSDTNKNISFHLYKPSE